ncbi:MAG: hypothetical protein JSW40_07975 [Candidatus Omnitrophota bacterium]|nr:MAG: hypothetical protein JSW40_07975 [Candidatus Omnitrophota bacterium]
MVVIISIILGSLWTLIPAGIAAILLIIRIYLEDITLQRKLPDYTDHAK